MVENQNIEWKVSWRDEYLKWICGFANAKGGKIFIGKNDKGEVTGVENHKRLMDDIPNKIQTLLGIICDVDLHEVDGQYYIEIDVKPYDVPIFKNIYSEKQLKDKGLNERQIKAVLYVKENGKITNKEYQNLNSVSRETSSRDLKSLVELGILKASGSKGAGSFFVLI